MGSASESPQKLSQAALLLELDLLGHVAPVYRPLVGHPGDGNPRTGQVRAYPPDELRRDCPNALSRAAVQSFSCSNRLGHVHVASSILHKRLQSIVERRECMQGIGRTYGFRTAYHCQCCPALPYGNSLAEWNHGGSESLLQQSNPQRPRSHQLDKVELVTEYHRTLFRLHADNISDYFVHLLLVVARMDRVPRPAASILPRIGIL
mmetsp:Transcript_17017/g.42514  ORF Transcript_17017/g.42514 Transcript_17017/m.42514 type:complete len:206 (-) Transcript_17017:409-1026(-)